MNNTDYDGLLARWSRFNTIYYAGPLVLLIILFESVSALSPYFFHMLVIYCFTALVHVLSYGFQAVCAQIHVSTEAQLESKISR